jgi:hypothetical protein
MGEVRIRDVYDNVKEGGQENGLAWLVIAVIPLSCCSMAFRCLCMYGMVWYFECCWEWRVDLSVHSFVRPSSILILIRCILHLTSRIVLNMH